MGEGRKQQVMERFKKYLSINPEGCWNWIGGGFNTGYGAFKIEGKQTTAHRASWTLHFGKIPDGLLICHKCDNRRCVNPAHLFLGTHRDNSQDALKKGRLKSHPKDNVACIRGHEYTDESTYRRHGYRYCRTCHALRSRAYRFRRRNGLTVAEARNNWTNKNTSWGSKLYAAKNSYGQT